MKKTNTMKLVYLSIGIIFCLMLILQVVIMAVNSRREAKNTTNAYLVQTESILDNNEREEEALIASLKEDYIVLAKAVAYYLDNCPSAVNDFSELNKICDLMSIDEIHIFNDQGVIVSSSVEEYVGYSFDSGEQIGYFKPMLSNKDLTMCQDATPNTAEGKPMMYAITWNEAGSQMVQIGIEPVRLFEELEKNEVSEIIKEISLDKNMAIIIANAETLDIVGSTIDSYDGKGLEEVSSLTNKSTSSSFITSVKLSGKKGNYFCRIDVKDEYCICVLQSHMPFSDRTLEFVLIISVYLLIASVVIIFIAKRLISSREANDEYLQMFASMSEIYYSLHLVNLEENTAVEYSSRNQVKHAFHSNQKMNATGLMIGIMHATMSDEYLERGLEFSDISTLAERLTGKKIISMELLGKNVGWIRMSFITFEEKNGIPIKAIIATQIIDEEKKTAEALYKKSYMDELTGCYNRRAYMDDIASYENNPIECNLAYISFDVNGLKTINDNLGHSAGDELICGASECMKNVFLKHGKIYRIGGDEFVGLLHADLGLIQMLFEEFNQQIQSWHGEHIHSISVSYGYVLASEKEGASFDEISELADKRMYEAKERYYQEKGIERRRT